VAGIEKKTGQTLNSPGLAHGLSTAPLASRHRGAGGGAVDNPAHCLLDHKPEDDISFRSPVQDAPVFTMLGRERTTYMGSIAPVCRFWKQTFAAYFVGHSYGRLEWRLWPVDAQTKLTIVRECS